MLDRTQPPLFQPVNEVKLPTYTTIALPNGCPLYVINIGKQPVMRLEVLFEAGVWHETTAGAAFFASKMLSEGTKKHSSAQISEHFDNVGAFLELGHTSDYLNVVTYGLPKHLRHILNMVQELLTESVFPEKEFEQIKNITTQNLKINHQKTAIQAIIKYREQLFGTAHPYGQTNKEPNITALQQADVIAHFKENIQQKPFKVFLSGAISDAEIRLVEQYLGGLVVAPKLQPNPIFAIETTVGAVYEPKDGALQSSIRMGQFAMLRTNPDFFPFLVCNEVFGGYFGSRLMKNIREDKGYTYGISSSLAILKNSAYFTIATDVKKEFYENTLTEIQREVDRLQNDLVGDDELQTVKNFMAGELAGSLNTPFEVADRVKVTVLYGLESAFYEHFIPNLRAISPQQVRDIAQRYYHNFVQTVVG